MKRFGVHVALAYSFHQGCQPAMAHLVEGNRSLIDEFQSGAVSDWRRSLAGQEDKVSDAFRISQH